MEKKVIVTGNRMKHGKIVITTEDVIKSYIIRENRIIILTDSETSKNGQNVYCYDFGGHLLWRIPADKPIDYYNYYLSIYFREENFMAYDFEGSEATIDIETGNILKRELIK